MVKNEAKFVWYSIISVIDYIDKIYIWDTGSTDGTKEIVEELISNYKGKTQIDFKKISKENFDEASVREEMLRECSAGDWILMIDGDEIWWKDSIRQVTDVIKRKGNEIESIVVPTVNLIGDIYHYQEAKAGRYVFFGKSGHYNLRAFSRNIPGLHSSAKPHGTWGLEDENGKMIQDRNPEKMLFLDAPYLHATHLLRAGLKILENKVYKRSQKLKHEIGLSFPKDFYYPEVLFYERPKSVACVWKKMDMSFVIRSYLETPLRFIHRRFFKSKVGY